MRALSNRQAEVYAFLVDFNAANERPPTRHEIARHFGWASDNAAEDHLKAMARKGVLRLVKGTARGIELS